MNNFIFKLLLFALCAISLSSCATMTRWSDSTEKNKKMYTVRVDSRTKGLPVYYNDKNGERYAGATPCNIYSDKCKIKYITVKNGEIYQTVKLKIKPRPSSYWNFVPYYTFIWGYIVDQSTGRGREYGQKDYYVDM